MGVKHPTSLRLLLGPESTRVRQKIRIRATQHVDPERDSSSIAAKTAPSKSSSQREKTLLMHAEVAYVVGRICHCSCLLYRVKAGNAALSIHRALVHLLAVGGSPPCWLTLGGDVAPTAARSQVMVLEHQTARLVSHPIFWPAWLICVPYSTSNILFSMLAFAFVA